MPEPGNPYEIEGVLNPASGRGPDGEMYLLPRLVAAGNISRIGLVRVLVENGVPVGVEREGIVLVAEGNAGRTRSLLVNEKKKLARFVGATPVYDVTVGDGPDQVPLRGLEKHFLKLPRNVKPKDVNVLDRKLKAMAPALPIPKGPVPTRVPRGGRQR